MDAVGGLLRGIGDGIVGLVGGAFRAFEAAVQAAFGLLQSLLPGLLLPIVGFVVLIAVAWSLIKR